MGLFELYGERFRRTRIHCVPCQVTRHKAQPDSPYIRQTKSNTYLLPVLLIDSIASILNRDALQVSRRDLKSQWEVQVDLLDWWGGEVLLEPLLLFDGGWRLVEAPVNLALASAHEEKTAEMGSGGSSGLCRRCELEDKEESGVCLSGGLPVQLLSLNRNLELLALLFCLLSVSILSPI